MQEPHELQYWIKHLKVSSEQLQKAVDKVGNGAAAVRKELAAEAVKRARGVPGGCNEVRQVQDMIISCPYVFKPPLEHLLRDNDAFPRQTAEGLRVLQRPLRLREHRRNIRHRVARILQSADVLSEQSPRPLRFPSGLGLLGHLRMLSCLVQARGH
ncbi:DUF3606 domain-containing protein [Bradyrhizobium sp.]|uniref:DUF3606 domain-containing protein n=1 Tax=Bradyrhizobium sp. TaxID=376 RepID=UPI0034457A11